MFFILFLIFPHLISCLESKGFYGSFCNETAPCNSLALLTCLESSCQCILPDSMIYVNKSEECVSLAEEACGHMSMDTSEVLLKCVDNSFCNNQGECQCHPEHFKTHQGICIIQKGFGEICNNSKECSESLGLSCVNETCQCDSAKSIDSLKFFDEDEEEDSFGQHRCLGRPSQPCLNGHCVPNATCEDDLQNRLIIRPLVDVKVCQCQIGFEESKSKKVCLAGFNKTCDTQSNRYCRKDLSCVGGQCVCKYPEHQIYDKDFKTCVSVVGGPCNPSDCIPNSICKRYGIPSQFIDGNNETEIEEDRATSSTPQSIYDYCECQDGFVENINRTCDVAYGHPCSQMLEEWKCDTLAGLSCRDGFCSCQDPGQVFDKTLMKCRGLVGSFCDPLKKNQCILNSYCKTHRNNFLPFGHCECNEDYEVTRERTCACLYCSEK